MSKKRQRNKRAKQVKAKKAMALKQGAFTIKPDQVEKEILSRAGKYAGAIQRVVAAGMKLLFSKEMHDRIFGSLRNDIPIEDQVGAGMVQVMIILFRESKGTMPPQAIIPAGTILIAKVLEYLDRTNTAKVTNDTFADAVEMFNVAMQREAKRAEENGNQMMPGGQGEQPPQEMPQQGPQMPSGMLGQQGV